MKKQTVISAKELAKALADHPELMVNLQISTAPYKGRSVQRFEDWVKKARKDAGII